MLVLSRKNGESVAIEFNGVTAFVTVLEIKGGQIRLGIEAPETVGIHRSEIWVDIQHENNMMPTCKMPFQVQKLFETAFS